MGRQQGKSTELIKLSNKHWCYIVCSTMQRAHQLSIQATNMGVEIPYPISVKELPIRSPYIKQILIDDVDEVLKALVGVNNIIQCTTSCEVEVR